MRILLHIGSPKTGTTTLQWALASQRAALLDEGVLYPTIDGKNHHNALSLFLYPEKPARGYVQRSGGNRALLVEQGRQTMHTLQEILGATRAHTVVLSSEFLFRIYPQGRLNQFAEILRSFTSDVKVVCYIRDPVSFYLAASAQALRASHQMPIPHAPKYLAILQSFSAEFDVHAHKYTRDQLHGNDVCLDFSFRYLNNIDLKPARDRNVSLSAEGLDIAASFRRQFLPDAVNRNDPEADQLYRFLLLAEQHVPGRSSLTAKPDVADYILSQFAPQIELLERDYKLSFASHSSAGTLQREDVAKLTSPSDIFVQDEIRKENLRNFILREIVRIP